MRPWVKTLRTAIPAMALAALLSALLAYGAALFYAWMNPKALIYQLDRRDVAPHEAGLEGIFIAEKLEAADGTPLTVWVAPGLPRRPVVVYLMGEAGSLADRAARLKRLAAEGYGVAALAWRGSGGAAGEPSEEAFLSDAATVYDALPELLGHRPTSWRVVAYGESLGGAVAARLAEERPLGAVVLESPFLSIRALAEENFAFLPAGLAPESFDMLASVQELQIPLLVMYGGRDASVPPEQSARIFAAAYEPKRVFYAPEAGHGALWSYGGFEAAAGFIEYFARFR
ncbi:alpha/beta hydrolase [Neomegalonema perideroedes]|uniref:alpha/beta hydrolase n=1 Tax=Neomegalonema perideroedes TaxID=217219 RepID=UPI000368846C|nr:alpha/beta hydrolase [Neomegalonema perideroedes]